MKVAENYWRIGRKKMTDKRNKENWTKERQIKMHKKKIDKIDKDIIILKSHRSFHCEELKKLRYGK